MGRRSDSSSDHTDDPYLSASVAQLLDDLAARTPAPGGGAAAALTCAMAAALVEMATSFASAQGLEAVRDRAHLIREQASGLAYADGRAYGVVLEALRMEKGDQRTAHLDEAVSAAIAVPMRVLELASEVATLAADVAETGNRNLEGDALAGSLLAEAAARSAATLAQMNMSMLSRHAVAKAHLERMRPALAKATRARERAVTAYAHV
jgi:formiminotetrahydrofolate cyclodeaminase